MRLFHLINVINLTSIALASNTGTYSTDGSDLDAFHKMQYDIGYGPEIFEAYVQPNITVFTNGETDEKVNPNHNGHAVKFHNMSPESVLLVWSGHGKEVKMGLCQPFGATGTASFPGHRFFFAKPDYVELSQKGVLRRFNIDSEGSMVNNYYYDPFYVEGDKETSDMNLMKLSFRELEKYNIMKRNRMFNEQYKKFTGREYLSMYPRDKPRHFFWPADYFGQEHWVTTKETQFETIPPAKEIRKIKGRPEERVLKDEDPRLLAEYRTKEPYLNLTFTVISCAPKVFEIQNFLSEAEVDHIVNIAKEIDMKPSSTGQDGQTGSEKATKTRTSYNTWVGRETDQIIDAIYRRSADLLRIDEALFRQRSDSERNDYDSKKTIAEQLQLVHYDVGQEYTAHHDFGYANAGDKEQGARFATLLFYLNEPEKGGETEFPRWFNGETSQGLTAAPRKGKAVLFYSQLPDGNMDDLSHHAALPVREGEKFLINLWVRDPSFN